MIHLESIRWDIAQKCNLNCKHCQTGDHRALNYHETTLEEAKQIVDKLYNANVESIGLLGGEPLLRKDIKELIAYMSAKGMKITINTNGLLLNEELLEFLFLHNCSILVSLDGASKETHEYLRGKGTFQKTIDKVKLATSLKKKYKLRNLIGLSIVLHQQNKGELKKLFEMGSNLEIDVLSMQGVYKTGNADKFWDTLSLTGEDILALGEEYISLMEKSYPFQIDERFLTNKAIKYLNEKLNRKIKYKFVGDGDGFKSAYIRCDGVMLPSAGLLSLEGDFAQNNIINHEIKYIFNSEIFKKWRELTSKQLYKTYYEPCIKCEFSGISCFPTPNAFFYNKLAPLEICEYVEVIEKEIVL
ncbi:TPA: radical SAM protein [Bacillus pseudomycoides]|nr:radical SAM protein [Bacillus pseudomycoides]